MAEVAGAAAVAWWWSWRLRTLAIDINRFQFGKWDLRRPSPTTARPNATEGASTEGDIIVDETRSSTATP